MPEAFLPKGSPHDHVSMCHVIVNCVVRRQRSDVAKKNRPGLALGKCRFRSVYSSTSVPALLDYPLSSLPNHGADSYRIRTPAFTIAYHCGNARTFNEDCSIWTIIPACMRQTAHSSDIDDAWRNIHIHTQQQMHPRSAMPG